MGRIILRVTIAAGALAVLWLWWTGATSGSVRTSSTALTTSFGELAGLVASYLVCVQVLLIARVPWFERAVGLDRLVAWHRTVGTTVVLLVLAHVGLMVLGGMLADHRDPITEYLSFFGQYRDMLTATIGTGVFVFVGLSSARLLRRMLPYEVWYWVHLSTYLAIFLTFLHQLSAGSDFIASPWHRALWWVMYLATAASVVAWRAGVPLLAFARHRFTVVAVVQESPRMSSVWIRAERLDELDVRAGQFLLFRFLSWGHLLSAHPYSISNVPERGMLRITVAQLGDHSRALARLRPATKVLIEGPFGRFTADRSRRAGALLVAGGAGIGPIRSLAEELATRVRSIVLVYRSRSAEDQALLAELATIRGVHVIPVVGRREQLGFDPLGAEALGRMIPDARLREAFICGPVGMTETVTASLRRLGMPGRHIHTEELSFA